MVCTFNNKKYLSETWEGAVIATVEDLTDVNYSEDDEAEDRQLRSAEVISVPMFQQCYTCLACKGKVMATTNTVGAVENVTCCNVLTSVALNVL
jgi:hypothetical protein